VQPPYSLRSPDILLIFKIWFSRFKIPTSRNRNSWKSRKILRILNSVTSLLVMFSWYLVNFQNLILWFKIPNSRNRNSWKCNSSRKSRKFLGILDSVTLCFLIFYVKAIFWKVTIFLMKNFINPTFKINFL